MAQNHNAPVVIYTDGSCLANPGPGGWAAILQWHENTREISGGEADTTNNRMELMATIMGLDAVTRPMDITVFTDSKYVMNGVTQWMPRWKINGWKTSSKKSVANRDLWEQLDTVLLQHKVHWRWIKGHSGNPLNERCDELARFAASAIRDETNGT